MLENLRRLALSSTDFPRRPAVSYMDYHADHVRLTRMTPLQGQWILLIGPTAYSYIDQGCLVVSFACNLPGLKILIYPSLSKDSNSEYNIILMNKLLN